MGQGSRCGDGSGGIHLRGGIQGRDVVVVQNVGRFGECFYFEALADGEIAGDAGVQIVDYRSANRISSDIKRALESDWRAGIAVQHPIASHVEDVAALGVEGYGQTVSVYEGGGQLGIEFEPRVEYGTENEGVTAVS